MPVNPDCFYVPGFTFLVAAQVNFYFFFDCTYRD